MFVFGFLDPVNLKDMLQCNMELFPAKILHYIIGHDMSGMGGDKDEVKNGC